MKLRIPVRLPSLSQWQKLPQVLSKRERFITVFLLFLFLASGFSLVQTFYNSRTVVVPANGGSLKEGMVGYPRFLNPVFSDANDADRDLVQLVFAGIMKYNAKEELVPDLAREVSIEEGGKTYEITLRENLQWSDGFKLAADDVIFTIQTIQDPKYKSPIRANWVGVEVEKISETKVRFKLSQPYAPFLERLTVKPIPFHIWKNVNPENFALSRYNLEAVGSGPYRVSKVSQSKSGPVQEIKLTRNLKYHSQVPFISPLYVKFYDTEKQLQSAVSRGEIQSFSISSASKISGSALYSFSLSRYFALFFNGDSQIPDDPVKKKEVRKALALATDALDLAQALFGDHGKAVQSPLLPETLRLKVPERTEATEDAILQLLAKQGYAKIEGKIAKIPVSSQGITRDLQLGSAGEDVRKLQECLAQDPAVYPEGTVSGSFGNLTRAAVIRFQEKYAQEILAPQGLTAGTGKVGGGTREKLTQLCFADPSTITPLSITISTLNQSPLKDAAQILKEQWEKFGITVSVDLQSAADLERNVLKPRNYQTLLFGEILGKIADPFPFWHSSQVKDPGLNLSSYENKKLDAILEQARKEADETKRIELYQQMQDILLEDMPAIALYDMDYLYVAPSAIQGIEAGMIADPSQRFAEVNQWYIKTKRAWK
ncbi:MAG: peptidoglycan-binding protein [Candidatus Wildermuthbacteria bacterium]|nr:peptidoglycan-binding protein [Candidatus Wildermuthbacteria bacterium]